MSLIVSAPLALVAGLALGLDGVSAASLAGPDMLPASAVSGSEAQLAPGGGQRRPAGGGAHARPAGGGGGARA
ncbi:MAG: hypothetical protein ACRECB_12700, partial [Novosphingobium sp.]